MATSLLIVNYHYIRDQAPVRGIYNVTPEFFAAQLDAIYAAGFRFVSLADIHAAVAGGTTSTLPAKACLITFDDGLRESFELGLSIMDRKGIPGVFYLSSMTLELNVVLDVHKFHYIQGRMNNDEILGVIPLQVRSRLDRVADDIIAAQYIWDEYQTGRVKYMFNFLLSAVEKRKIIGDLFENCVQSESCFAESLYMTPSQVRELARRGYLGSHGHQHLPLAVLPEASINHELANSRRLLAEFSGSVVDTVSYPYGGNTAISKIVINSAAAQGFVTGVTMIRGLNTAADLLNRPLQLKRFDTNDVFGGKSEHLYKGILQ